MATLRTDRPGWADRAAGLVLGTVRRGPRVRVVAVEGRSGSGKSTVAEQLRLALAGRGEPVALLTMEDLYPGWGGLAESSQLLAEWVLIPLSRGRAACWRRYDWGRGGFGEDREVLPAELVEGGGTLIVEGCGSGAAPVRDLVDLLVWVEASEETRSERLDQREDAALYAPHRDRWARQEDALYAVDPPWKRADLRLDNG